MRTETFGYDALNRLVSVDFNGNAKTVQYDSIGNITYKSDVGSYQYGPKPHAVIGVDPTTATEPTGGSTTTMLVTLLDTQAIIDELGAQGKGEKG